MRLTSGKKIRLWLFIIIGISLFGSAVYIIGKQENLIGKNFVVYGIFKDVNGLNVGNNVRYSGVNVGTVSGLKIINDTSVRVKATLENKVHQFIRQDSKMEIGTEGVMGSKILKITPGNPSVLTVKKQGQLQTTEPVEADEIIEELGKSSVHTSKFAENLANISGKINRGKGIIGNLITDTSLNNNLSKISNNTARLTHEFNLIARKINK
jgi:phospholipid/cholesterol/gamma-HCH transport system substrate-binding protein